MRLFFGIAALALLIVLVLRDRFPRGAPARQTNEPAAIDTTLATGRYGVTYIVPGEPPVLAVPPSEMRSVVEAHRRVRPDRRIVLAVAAVHTMLTGTPQRPVFARWTNRGWVIEYSDAHTLAGTLPELPSLEDGRALLATWAQRVAMDHAVTRAAVAPALVERARQAVDSASAPIAIEALAAIDRQWRRSRNAALLPVAAEALTALAMFVDDRTDMADAIFARSLAASAAARVLSAHAPRATDALLASLLGYGSEALDSAQALDADDPVRLFIGRRDSTLLRRADDGAPWAQYLFVRRQAEVSTSAWATAIARFARWPELSTAGIESGLHTQGFDFHEALPPAFAVAVFDELDRVAPPRTFADRLATAKRRLRRRPDAGAGSLGAPGEMTVLERRLTDARRRFGAGPFADSTVIDGYYRSAYFAAVAATAEFALQQRSSIDDANALADRMKGQQPSAAGAEYARWVLHLADAKAGREVKPSLATDVARAEWLGEQQIVLSRRAFAKGMPFNQHLDVVGVSRSYAAHLDSRPSHLWALGAVAYNDIWDMPAAERWYRRAAALDRTDRLAIWVIRFVRDSVALRRIVEDSTRARADRVDAARYLGIDSLAPNAYVRRWFERLVTERPDDWSTRSAYIELLDPDRDGPAIERVAREWLMKWQDQAKTSFEPVNAHVALSRALTWQRRYTEAWDAVDSVIPSYVGAAMNQGARVLGRLGRLDEAYALAQEAAGRYPDAASSHAMVTEVLWRRGEDAQAAQYLHEHAQRFDAWAWRREIALSFLEVFGEKRDGSPEAALQQLVAVRLPGWVLGQLGIGLRQRKRPDLAFAMHVRASEPTGAGNQQLPMQAYASLRDWRGEDAAIAWLRRLTPGVEGATAMILYQDDAFEELWTLDPPGRAYSPFTWLMRAAAAARDPNVARHHRAELLAYYRQPIDDDYHRMGRHLMGLMSSEELLDRATTAERRCEIAYYLGVRARAEGRLYEAADWFEAALETRQIRDGELIWSAQQLAEWANQGKTLAALEARP